MKLAILITTYNRPNYLRQCLESVKAADLSQVSTVMIVDDASTDPETRKLIDEFDLPGIELVKAFSKESRSIKGSLLFGLDVLFNSCDVVTNLDGDAIVSKDSFNRLLALREKYPGYIISGFNCSTKNKNGSVRHRILEQGDGWNKKYSVGGINMMFDHLEYLQIVKPALENCIKTNQNWDHQACIISNEGSGKPIVVVEPSVVQHIGIDSSMGHSAGGEPPDVAEDFDWTPFPLIPSKPIEDLTLFKKLYKEEMGKIRKPQGIIPAGLSGYYEPSKNKLQLPQVTLIAVDDNIDSIIKAADISCRNIQFGSVKLLSSKDSADPRAVKIRHLGSKKEYSQFLLKEIVNYVDTPFLIVIQGDGFILDHTKWSDDFLDYDYAGAVWNFRDHKRTGNGGFSIRSRKLQQVLKDDPLVYLQNDHLIKNFAEDHVICYIYREFLERQHGIKFAPEEVCNRFSFEGWGLNPPYNKYNGSFGFHGFSIDFSDANLPYVPYLLPSRQII